MSRLLQPKILFVLICIFFLFTRLYKITEIPPSVYWDEASIGYNAYSISQTGRDEWGKFLPIHFRAFGEFKLPVYIYAVVPFVKIFGLNAFSVRLPAVLFSLGVVVLTYFLTKKLSENTTAGLLSSLFITLSPWFFIFSRTGYEATAGLMFYLLAIYFFLKFDRNAWYLFFSVVSLILSAYSYNSFRIITPMTILILIINSIKYLKNTLRNSILPLLLSAIFLAVSIIPIYRLYVYDAGTVRLQTIGATSATVLKNYFSHFSLDFLFLHGDKNLRSQQFGFGQLYLLDPALLLLGLLYIIRSKSKYSLLPLVLLLLGPIPAAITKESPHALRSISMIPFIAIICAIGVSSIRRFTQRRFLINLAIVVIFLAFFLNYFLKFLSVYSVQSSEHWQYGYKKIFTDFQTDFSKYDKVIVSDEYAQPYIFALFYGKIDPNNFRQKIVRNSIDQWGFSAVKSFDKFLFSKIRLSDLPKGKSLIFASPGEKLADVPVKGVILNLDNSVAFYTYEYTR